MAKYWISFALLMSTIQLYSFEHPYFTIGAGVVVPSKNSSSVSNSTSVLFPGTFPGSSLFILPNVVWENKYHVGYELFALAGVSFLCHCRCDLEFLYQYLKREVSGHYDWREIDAITITVFAENTDNPIHHAVANTHLYVALTNFYYDIEACNFLNFYLGGGFGTAWLHSSSTLESNILNISATIPSSSTIESSPKLGGTAFAWQFKIGTKFCIARNLLLELNYRLLGTTRFHARISQIITNPNTPGQSIFEIPERNIRGFLNNSINLAFTYVF